MHSLGCAFLTGAGRKFATLLWCIWSHAPTSMSSWTVPPFPRNAMLSREPSTSQKQILYNWINIVVRGQGWNSERSDMQHATLADARNEWCCELSSGNGPFRTIKWSSRVIRSCPQFHGCISRFMDVTPNGRWATWTPEHVESFRTGGCVCRYGDGTGSWWWRWSREVVHVCIVFSTRFIVRVLKDVRIPWVLHERRFYGSWKMYVFLGFGMKDVLSI